MGINRTSKYAKSGSEFTDVMVSTVDMLKMGQQFPYTRHRYCQCQDRNKDMHIKCLLLKDKTKTVIIHTCGYIHF